MIFQYIALSKKGKIKKMLEAEDLEDAKNLLYQKNLIVIKLKPFDLQKKLTLSKKEILNFTQEVAKLLYAGLSLYETLTALKEKYEQQRIYPFFLELCNQIKRGKSFSKTLSAYPHIFDLLYCSMVANAEKTGSLAKTMDEIADILKKHQNLKKKLMGALLYPAILSIFCFVVIASLIFFVIPSLFELFEGKNLHPLTKIVLSISQIATDLKLYFAFFFLLLLSIIFLGSYVENWRKNLYCMMLSFPYVRELMQKVALIRFSRSFSVLLHSGISYVEGLRLAKKVMKHPLLEKEIEQAETKVIQGEKLSQAFKGSKKIPPLVIRLLEIAEESAKTSSMLQNIAMIYEEELEGKLLQLTTILQPLLLVVLGIIVGFIVLSVLLPLTDVSSFVG